jgi:hypothetical protein
MRTHKRTHQTNQLQKQYDAFAPSIRRRRPPVPLPSVGCIRSRRAARQGDGRAFVFSPPHATRRDAPPTPAHERNPRVDFIVVFFGRVRRRRRRGG